MSTSLSITELDALPIDAKIVGRWDLVWYKIPGREGCDWANDALAEIETTRILSSVWGPFRLYTPEEQPQPDSLGDSGSLPHN